MSASLGPAWLFCPADRPDRYAKAFARADVVILDLEDAVIPSGRAAARRMLDGSSLELDRTVLRVNPVDSADHAADVGLARRLGLTRIMLPKAEEVRSLDHLDDFQVIGLCETALGIEAASDLARHRAMVGLMWGAEDLVASTKGRASRAPSGAYYELARAARVRVLLAARAAGIDPVDAVYLDIGDLSGLRAEAVEAVDSGFAAKACIHPAQVSVVRAAFDPTTEQVEWAQNVIAAASTGGVVRVGDQMIDGPVLQQARNIIAASRRSAG